ncbi:uridine monophosphate kinase [Candidatus Dependentiae bacterium]|nr:uridine monophosphate kinase [Candidatus Dependentiae bacterium]
MKVLLIKLTGELFSYEREGQKQSPSLKIKQINNIIQQIKTLNAQHHVGLVIGGGNFFRGAITNHSLGLEKTSAHNVGMLSTIVNGVVLQDLLSQANVPSSLLSAFSCPSIALPLSQNSIDNAFMQHKCIIFVGGTGNPFFTTDTNAVLRALQLGADEVWKATKVDGIYADDPLIHPDSKFYKTISYQEVLDKKLTVMDKTAITLAQEHNIPIRVFNLFTPNALHKALENPDFGSRIQ